ncbi:MAG TPA: MFS transporter [Gammaproteobacteria bacterium]
MRQTLFSLFALFLAMLTLMLGSGHLGTFLSLRLKAADEPNWLIGLVMAGYYIGLVAGAWVCPKVLQRVGHIRAFAVFAAINSANVLAQGIFLNAIVWLPLRVLTGLSMMGMFMVVESWLNERAPREYRGRVFSVYMVVSYLGLGGGQFMLNIAPIESPLHFFVIGALFSLCLLPVSLTRAMHPAPVEPVHFNWSRLYKTAPFGIVGAFVAGLMNGSFYALAPLYVRAIGLDVSEIAIFMAATIFGGLMMQYPIGMISDRVDRRTVLATLTILSAATSIGLLAVGGEYLLLLYVTGVLFGGLLFTSYPVAVAHTHDHFEANQVVTVSAALIVVYGLGAAIGPISASGLVYLLGPRGLFVFIASAGLLFGLVAWLKRTEEEVSVEDQEPFVPVPSTASPIITTLDPRADEEQVDLEEIEEVVEEDEDRKAEE